MYTICLVNPVVKFEMDILNFAPQIIWLLLHSMPLEDVIFQIPFLGVLTHLAKK